MPVLVQHDKSSTLLASLPSGYVINGALNGEFMLKKVDVLEISNPTKQPNTLPPGLSLLNHQHKDDDCYIIIATSTPPILKNDSIIGVNKKRP